jgi:integrase
VRLSLIVKALLWTGKRRGEMRSLLWSDVDLDRGIVTLRATNTKAKRLQVCALNSKAMEVFREAARLRISDYCFPAPSGVFYSELNKHWEKFRATIGLGDVVLHDLRRTAITTWASAGVSPLVIMKLSGHSSLSMVTRYCQMAPEDVREASEKLCPTTTTTTK